jgi:hypothetical protein
MARKGWDNPIKGEKSPMAKLNDNAVRHIRTTEESGCSLARAYGVSHTPIKLVRQRQTWAHVQ